MQNRVLAVFPAAFILLIFFEKMARPGRFELPTS